MFVLPEGTSPIILQLWPKSPMGFFDGAVLLFVAKLSLFLRNHWPKNVKHQFGSCPASDLWDTSNSNWIVLTVLPIFHHGNFSHYGLGQVYASILKFQSLWIGSWWLQTLDKWFHCKHILILWIPLPVLVAQVIAVIRFWTWRMHILWPTIFWVPIAADPMLD